MTAVKFCGMTREEDLAAAVELDVAAVGFVLWPGSPRYVDATRVARLIAPLPPRIIPVGVYVRPTSDDLRRGLESGIRVAQLHGSADAADEAPCEVWVASSLTEEGLLPEVDDRFTVVLDANDPIRYGGTGRTIDWTRAARVAARRRVVLAGGLTAANVAQAIRDVRPYAVDVASGIEDRPGVKNLEAMRAFVDAVREADDARGRVR